ncbi:hypothetical protein R3P38DRAFT_284251 [Favolaschia claudopus]|uniref:Uncharacterized protein n=1 Tax=Favolaschia claudopus TaxID=2862362 RepID=A0AAV9ZP60_9AGAR
MNEWMGGWVTKRRSTFALHAYSLALALPPALTACSSSLLRLMSPHPSCAAALPACYTLSSPARRRRLWVIVFLALLPRSTCRPPSSHHATLRCRTFPFHLGDATVRIVAMDTGREVSATYV